MKTRIEEPETLKEVLAYYRRAYPEKTLSSFSQERDLSRGVSNEMLLQLSDYVWKFYGDEVPFRSVEWNEEKERLLASLDEYPQLALTDKEVAVSGTREELFESMKSVMPYVTLGELDRFDELLLKTEDGRRVVFDADNAEVHEVASLLLEDYGSRTRLREIEWGASAGAPDDVLEALKLRAATVAEAIDALQAPEWTEHFGKASIEFCRHFLDSLSNPEETDMADLAFPENCGVAEQIVFVDESHPPKYSFPALPFVRRTAEELFELVREKDPQGTARTMLTDFTYDVRHFGPRHRVSRMLFRQMLLYIHLYHGDDAPVSEVVWDEEQFFRSITDYVLMPKEPGNEVVMTADSPEELFYKAAASFPKLTLFELCDETLRLERGHLRVRVIPEHYHLQVRETFEHYYDFLSPLSEIDIFPNERSVMSPKEIFHTLHEKLRNDARGRTMTVRAVAESLPKMLYGRYQTQDLLLFLNSVEKPESTLFTELTWKDHYTEPRLVVIEEPMSHEIN